MDFRLLRLKLRFVALFVFFAALAVLSYVTSSYASPDNSAMHFIHRIVDRGTQVVKSYLSGSTQQSELAAEDIRKVNSKQQRISGRFSTDDAPATEIKQASAIIGEVSSTLSDHQSMINRGANSRPNGDNLYVNAPLLSTPSVEQNNHDIEIPASWTPLSQPFATNAEELPKWRDEANAKWVEYGVLPSELLLPSSKNNLKTKKLADVMLETKNDKATEEPSKCPPYDEFGVLEMVNFSPGGEDDPVGGYNLAKLAQRIFKKPDFFGSGSEGWSEAKTAGRVSDSYVNPAALLSLGDLGCVTLRTIGGAIVDGAGAAFHIYENPFKVTDPDKVTLDPSKIKQGIYNRPEHAEETGWPRAAQYYIERGEVSVSETGEAEDYVTLPCSKERVVVFDPKSGEKRSFYPGCVGNMPMIYGGEPFKLSQFPGAPKKVRFIRICDAGGNDATGLDIDAVGVLQFECDQKNKTEVEP